MTKEEFLPGTGMYDAYVLPEIRTLHYQTLEQEYIASSLSSGGNRVPEIAGIEKVDERTVAVTIEGVDPKAVWNLGGVQVVPRSYYGENFKKGDLSGVKARNSAPMGAGAYVFESYENNLVTLGANENYFKGEPVIPTIKFQVTATANKLEGVRLGEYDISDPPASQEMVEQAKAAGLHFELVDNLGYGYIGINARRVTDLNVRKGLMHLMNRYPAIETYYGELAEVIERPMSKVSWAYPQSAQAYYAFDPDRALEYFKKAGYEQVEGKLVLGGEQMRLVVGISGQGAMDHPSAAILTQMKLELEKLGGVLEIQDVSDSILSDRLYAGEWDLWVAGWGAEIDPDMYQAYHSQGPSNYFGLQDGELDQLIEEARQTTNVAVRKEKYAQALDIVMDNAVEMPVYQRKNLYVFNPEVIDISSLPKDMSPYYTYFAEVETLRLK